MLKKAPELQNNSKLDLLFVSVIIPNYNHAVYLKQRIDSVLDQTYQNFELIILDDCSTDDSKKIIDQYQNDPKIFLILYNETNSGSTFKQWQKGLEIAKGNLVWFAESDDFMHPSFLEKAVAAFKNDATLGIFQCGSHWIDGNGIIHNSDNTERHSRAINGKEFILKQMINGNSIYNASAVVFNKTMLQLPLDKSITSLKYCGDWLFWIKILERSNLFFLNENLNNFRRHTQNVSGKAEKEGLFFLEGIKVYRYIKKCYSDSFNFLDKHDKIWAYRFTAKDYPFKVVVKFIINAVYASFLIPFYVLWFKIKMLLAKSGTNLSG